MAKGKTTNPSSRPPRNSNPRGKSDQDIPKPPDEDMQPIDESGEGENPEWWRGDPGKRGEVL